MEIIHFCTKSVACQLLCIALKTVPFEVSIYSPLGVIAKYSHFVLKADTMLHAIVYINFHELFDF